MNKTPLGDETPRPYRDDMDFTRFRMELLSITPEDAAKILRERNGKNRSIIQAQITKLKAVLESDIWTVNAETIKFTKEGKLQDGQHRLTGAVLTGKTIVSWVAFGCDPEAYNTIDRGSSKTTGDDLDVIGEKNARGLAAALNLVVMEE